MTWRKLGLVHAPSGSRDWALTNASYPTATLRSAERLRIYYTSLDTDNYGRGSYLDVDPADPRRVMDVSDAPILDIGEAGDFDDCGVNPFSVVELAGRRLMYYGGWQRTLRAPFAIFTGLAIEQEDGRFAKWGRVPVLERTNAEPHFRGAPFVINDGARLRMWYVSSAHWEPGAGGLHYRVSIRHAVSDDGVTWLPDKRLCLEPEGDEYAVGRPCVVRDGEMFRMWYSIRSFTRPYTIGYAESCDGMSWRRMDGKAGIARSQSGWDSEMLCFPNIVDAGGQRYLFYNGNRHGASGFGCAVWTDDA